MAFYFPKQNLARGARDASVRLLQEALKRLGFFPKNVGSTGFFGPVTQRAVFNFQKKYIKEVGKPTGMANPLTLKKISILLSSPRAPVANAKLFPIWWDPVKKQGWSSQLGALQRPSGASPTAFFTWVWFKDNKPISPIALPTAAPYPISVAPTQKSVFQKGLDLIDSAIPPWLRAKARIWALEKAKQGWGFNFKTPEQVVAAIGNLAIVNEARDLSNKAVNYLVAGGTNIRNRAKALLNRVGEDLVRSGTVIPTPEEVAKRALDQAKTEAIDVLQKSADVLYSKMPDNVKRAFSNAIDRAGDYIRKTGEDVDANTLAQKTYLNMLSTRSGKPSVFSKSKEFYSDYFTKTGTYLDPDKVSRMSQASLILQRFDKEKQMHKNILNGLGYYISNFIRDAAQDAKFGMNFPGRVKRKVGTWFSNAYHLTQAIWSFGIDWSPLRRTYEEHILPLENAIRDLVSPDPDYLKSHPNIVRRTVEGPFTKDRAAELEAEKRFREKGEKHISTIAHELWGLANHVSEGLARRWIDMFVPKASDIAPDGYFPSGWDMIMDKYHGTHKWDTIKTPEQVRADIKKIKADAAAIIKNCHSDAACWKYFTKEFDPTYSRGVLSYLSNLNDEEIKSEDEKIRAKALEDSRKEWEKYPDANEAVKLVEEKESLVKDITKNTSGDAKIYYEWVASGSPSGVIDPGLANQLEKYQPVFGEMAKLNEQAQSIKDFLSANAKFLGDYQGQVGELNEILSEIQDVSNPEIEKYTLLIQSKLLTLKEKVETQYLYNRNKAAIDRIIELSSKAKAMQEKLTSQDPKVTDVNGRITMLNSIVKRLAKLETPEIKNLLGQLNAAQASTGVPPHIKAIMSKYGFRLEDTAKKAARIREIDAWLSAHQEQLSKYPSLYNNLKIIEEEANRKIDLLRTRQTEISIAARNFSNAIVRQQSDEAIKIANEAKIFLDLNPASNKFWSKEHLKGVIAQLRAPQFKQEVGQTLLWKNPIVWGGKGLIFKAMQIENAALAGYMATIKWVSDLIGFIGTNPKLKGLVPVVKNMPPQTLFHIINQDIKNFSEIESWKKWFDEYNEPSGFVRFTNLIPEEEHYRIIGAISRHSNLSVPEARKIWNGMRMFVDVGVPMTIMDISTWANAAISVEGLGVVGFMSPKSWKKVVSGVELGRKWVTPGMLPRTILKGGQKAVELASTGFLLDKPFLSVKGNILATVWSHEFLKVQSRMRLLYKFITPGVLAPKYEDIVREAWHGKKYVEKYTQGIKDAQNIMWPGMDIVRLRNKLYVASFWKELLKVNPDIARQLEITSEEARKGSVVAEQQVLEVMKRLHLKEDAFNTFAQEVFNQYFMSDEPDFKAITRLVGELGGDDKFWKKLGEEGGEKFAFWLRARNRQTKLMRDLTKVQYGDRYKHLSGRSKIYFNTLFENVDNQGERNALWTRELHPEYYLTKSPLESDAEFALRRRAVALSKGAYKAVEKDLRKASALLEEERRIIGEYNLKLWRSVTRRVIWTDSIGLQQVSNLTAVGKHGIPYKVPIKKIEVTGKTLYQYSDDVPLEEVMYRIFKNEVSSSLDHLRFKIAASFPLLGNKGTETTLRSLSWLDLIRTNINNEGPIIFGRKTWKKIVEIANKIRKTEYSSVKKSWIVGAVEDIKRLVNNEVTIDNLGDKVKKIEREFSVAQPYYLDEIVKEIAVVESLKRISSAGDISYSRLTAMLEGGWHLGDPEFDMLRLIVPTLNSRGAIFNPMVSDLVLGIHYSPKKLGLQWGDRFGESLNDFINTFKNKIYGKKLKLEIINRPITYNSPGTISHLFQTNPFPDWNTFKTKKIFQSMPARASYWPGQAVIQDMFGNVVSFPQSGDEAIEIMKPYLLKQIGRETQAQLYTAIDQKNSAKINYLSKELYNQLTNPDRMVYPILPNSTDEWRFIHKYNKSQLELVDGSWKPKKGALFWPTGYSKKIGATNILTPEQQQKMIEDQFIEPLMRKAKNQGLLGRRVVWVTIGPDARGTWPTFSSQYFVNRLAKENELFMTAMPFTKMTSPKDVLKFIGVDGICLRGMMDPDDLFSDKAILAVIGKSKLTWRGEAPDFYNFRGSVLDIIVKDPETRKNFIKRGLLDSDGNPFELVGEKDSLGKPLMLADEEKVSAEYLAKVEYAQGAALRAGKTFVYPEDIDKNFSKLDEYINDLRVSLADSQKRLHWVSPKEIGKTTRYREFGKQLNVSGKPIEDIIYTLAKEIEEEQDHLDDVKDLLEDIKTRYKLLGADGQIDISRLKQLLKSDQFRIEYHKALRAISKSELTLTDLNKKYLLAGGQAGLELTKKNLPLSWDEVMKLTNNVSYPGMPSLLRMDIPVYGEPLLKSKNLGWYAFEHYALAMTRGKFVGTPSSADQVLIDTVGKELAGRFSLLFGKTYENLDQNTKVVANSLERIFSIFEYRTDIFKKTNLKYFKKLGKFSSENSEKLIKDFFESESGDLPRVVTEMKAAIYAAFQGVLDNDEFKNWYVTLTSEISHLKQKKEVAEEAISNIIAAKKKLPGAIQDLRRLQKDITSTNEAIRQLNNMQEITPFMVLLLNNKVKFPFEEFYKAFVDGTVTPAFKTFSDDIVSLFNVASGTQKAGKIKTVQEFVIDNFPELRKSIPTEILKSDPFMPEPYVLNELEDKINRTQGRLSFVLGQIPGLRKPGELKQLRTNLKEFKGLLKEQKDRLSNLFEDFMQVNYKEQIRKLSINWTDSNLFPANTPQEIDKLRGKLAYWKRYGLIDITPDGKLANSGIKIFYEKKIINKLTKKEELISLGELKILWLPDLASISRLDMGQAANDTQIRALKQAWNFYLKNKSIQIYGPADLCKTVKKTIFEGLMGDKGMAMQKFFNSKMDDLSELFSIRKTVKGPPAQFPRKDIDTIIAGLKLTSRPYPVNEALDISKKQIDDWSLTQELMDLMDADPSFKNKLKTYNLEAQRYPTLVWAGQGIIIKGRTPYFDRNFYERLNSAIRNNVKLIMPLDMEVGDKYIYDYLIAHKVKVDLLKMTPQIVENIKKGENPLFVLFPYKAKLPGLGQDLRRGLLGKNRFFKLPAEIQSDMMKQSLTAIKSLIKDKSFYPFPDFVTDLIHYHGATPTEAIKAYFSTNWRKNIQKDFQQTKLTIMQSFKNEWDKAHGYIGYLKGEKVADIGPEDMVKILKDPWNLWKEGMPEIPEMRAILEARQAFVDKYMHLINFLEKEVFKFEDPEHVFDKIILGLQKLAYMSQAPMFKTPTLFKIPFGQNTIKTVEGLAKWLLDNIHNLPRIKQNVTAPFGKLMPLWVRAVLYWRAGWHVWNFLGDEFQALMAGQSLETTRDVLGLEIGMLGKYMKESMDLTKTSPIPFEVWKRGRAVGLFADLPRGMKKVLQKYFSKKMITNPAGEQFSLDDILRAVSGNWASPDSDPRWVSKIIKLRNQVYGKDDLFQAVRNKAMVFEADIELFSDFEEKLRRAALFHDLMFNQAMSFAQAQTKTLKYLFDYRDLTWVGQQFRKIFPFYTYTAKTIELYFELALKAGPGKWIAAKMFLDAYETSLKEYVAKYLDEVAPKIEPKLRSIVIENLKKSLWGSVHIPVGPARGIWFRPHIGLWDLMMDIAKPAQAIDDMFYNPQRVLFGFGWHPIISFIIEKATKKKYWDVQDIAKKELWFPSEVAYTENQQKEYQEQIEALQGPDRSAFDSLLSQFPIWNVWKGLTDIGSYAISRQTGLLNSKAVSQLLKFYGLNIRKFIDLDIARNLYYSCPPSLRSKLKKENPFLKEILKEYHAVKAITDIYKISNIKLRNKYISDLQRTWVLNTYYDLEDDEKDSGKRWINAKKNGILVRPEIKKIVEEELDKIPETPWNAYAREKYQEALIYSYGKALRDLLPSNWTEFKKAMTESDLPAYGLWSDVEKQWINPVTGKLLVNSVDEINAILGGVYNLQINKDKVEAHSDELYYENYAMSKQEYQEKNKVDAKYHWKLANLFAILPDNLDSLPEEEQSKYWDAYYAYFNTAFTEKERARYIKSQPEVDQLFRERMKLYLEIWEKKLIPIVEGKVKGDYFKVFFSQPEWFQNAYFVKNPGFKSYYLWEQKWGELRMADKAWESSHPGEYANEAWDYFWAPQYAEQRKIYAKQKPEQYAMYYWQQLCREAANAASEYSREGNEKKASEYWDKWRDLYWSDKYKKEREFYWRKYPDAEKRDKENKAYSEIWDKINTQLEKDPGLFRELLYSQPKWFIDKYFGAFPDREGLFAFQDKYMSYSAQNLLEASKFLWAPENKKYRDAWEAMNPGIIKYMEFWRKLSAFSMLGNWDSYWTYFWLASNKSYRDRYFSEPENREKTLVRYQFYKLPKGTFEERKKAVEFYKAHPILSSAWSQTMTPEEAKLFDKIQEYYSLGIMIPETGTGRDYLLEWRKYETAQDKYLEENPDLQIYFQERSQTYTGQRKEVWAELQQYLTFETPFERNHYISLHSDLEDFFMNSKPKGIRVIAMLQDQYYKLPFSSRQAFLERNPILSDYWEISILPWSFFWNKKKFSTYQKIFDDIKDHLNPWIYGQWVTGDKSLDKMPLIWSQPGSSDEEKWLKRKVYGVVMRTWIDVLKQNEMMGIYFFRKMPDWIRDYYYSVHPEKQYLSKEPLRRFLDEPLRIWAKENPDLDWAYKIMYKYGRNVPYRLMERVRQILVQEGIWADVSKKDHSAWAQWWEDRIMTLNEIKRFDLERIPLLKSEMRKAVDYFAPRMHLLPFSRPRIAKMHPYW